MSESFHERLSRLRRDAPRGVSPLRGSSPLCEASSLRDERVVADALTPPDVAADVAHDVAHDVAGEPVDASSGANADSAVESSERTRVTPALAARLDRRRRRVAHTPGANPAAVRAATPIAETNAEASSATSSTAATSTATSPSTTSFSTTSSSTQSPSAITVTSPAPALPNISPRASTSDATLSPAARAWLRPTPSLVVAPRAPTTCGPPERLSTSDEPHGLVCARLTRFERAHAHGRVALERALTTDRERLAQCAREPRLAELDMSTALYLDTETTGLSGGAGTYVFMIGLGRFVDGAFEVWQGFLTHPAHEAALLIDVMHRIERASCVVSFFGKAFDRHRLEDKMRLHGITPPFARVPHLDLYHPLRRLHRGRFENCRLKTLERELAGVEREDDLPGSFAPAAWFDFLAERPHRLEGVFRHNLEDVLSLVALLPSAAEGEEPQATTRRRSRAKSVANSAATTPVNTDSSSASNEGANSDG